LPAHRQTVARFAPNYRAHKRYFSKFHISYVHVSPEAPTSSWGDGGWRLAGTQALKPASICFNLLRGLTGKPFLGLTLLLSAAMSGFFNGQGR
jgi:hypothetical protein